MSKTSFKFKLIALCVFLCGISALIGGISYFSTQKLERTQNHLAKDIMPRSETLMKLDVAYQKVRIEVRSMGLEGLTSAEREAAIQSSITAVSEYEAIAKKLSDLIIEEQDRALYKNVEGEWANFKQIGLRAIELAKSNDEAARTELKQIFSVACPTAAASFQAALDKYEDHLESEVHETVEEVDHVAHITNVVNALVTFAGVIFGLFAGSLLALKISRTIQSIATKLGNSSQALQMSSDEASTSAASLAESTTEQAASVQETSASLEEISSMIDVTATNTKKSRELVDSSLHEVERGKTTVKRMIDSMGTIDHNTTDIMKQVETNNAQMNDIVALINRIEDKTKVINDIVFQTKLLSFNASVEAARAGEAGKGFAVVAEEVGNLAAMSGKAAIEIGELITSSVEKVNHIAKDSSSKIEVLINEAKRSVTSGNQVAQECSEVFEKIVVGVSSVAGSVAEITSATSEQAKGVGEIKEAVRQIDETTQSNSLRSSEAAEVAQAISNQSEVLASLVDDLIVVVNGKLSNVVAQKKPTAKAKTPAVAPSSPRPTLKIAPKSAEAFEVDPSDERFKEI